MPLAPFISLARSSQVVLVLALTGCLDPALSSDDSARDVADVDSADDAMNERKRNLALYVEPVSNASIQADIWAVSNPDGAARMEVIASQQIGIWIGDWTNDVVGEVDDAVTRAGDALQTFVLYNIPGRDCGFWSAGGASDAIEYQQFIADVAAGLAGRRAIVVLEPDALSLAEDCGFTEAEVDERYAMISDAVTTLMVGDTRVYIDAGDSNWIPSGDMADRLTAAGVLHATGFALNVSHTEFTDDEVGYAEELRTLLGTDVRYVVDTSRNGVGPTFDNQWCNPLGRSLGEFPSLDTGVDGMDAKLWVKPPGESDGSCNGGPIAGAWWPEYAEELALVAGF